MPSGGAPSPTTVPPLLRMRDMFDAWWNGGAPRALVEGVLPRAVPPGTILDTPTGNYSWERLANGQAVYKAGGWVNFVSGHSASAIGMPLGCDLSGGFLPLTGRPFLRYQWEFTAWLSAASAAPVCEIGLKSQVAALMVLGYTAAIIGVVFLTTGADRGGANTWRVYARQRPNAAAFDLDTGISAGIPHRFAFDYREAATGATLALKIDDVVVHQFAQADLPQVLAGEAYEFRPSFCHLNAGADAYIRGDGIYTIELV